MKNPVNQMKAILRNRYWLFKFEFHKRSKFYIRIFCDILILIILISRVFQPVHASRSLQTSTNFPLDVLKSEIKYRIELARCFDSVCNSKTIEDISKALTGSSENGYFYLNNDLKEKSLTSLLSDYEKISGIKINDSANIKILQCEGKIGDYLRNKSDLYFKSPYEERNENEMYAKCKFIGILKIKRII
jgi:hypothetical protein